MCDDVTRVEKYLVTQSNGKNGLEKNICHCNLIQFSPKHTRQWLKVTMFSFFIFSQLFKPNFGPTGAYYQKWNNFIARGMVVKSKCRLATNNIYTNVVVLLLTAKHQFSWLWFGGYVILYLICNQYPLLMDIRLLQGIYILPSTTNEDPLTKSA